jgi:type I phosphodiesterase/nucleotide pyrophosphatase
MRPAPFRPALLLLLACPLAAQVERVVILKVDGVPAEVLEREVQRINPATNKSDLPWIDHVFRAGGASVPNFYVRAISLSAPSWSMLDTGQHLEIRGNAEFDRYTGHVYDYLNFFPFYVGYALSHKVDMPGVEVLDDLKIPLLIDRFPYPAVYQGPQLYQRGVRWQTLQHSLTQRFSHSLRELLDEWTLGFEVGNSVEQQTERELIQKLADPGVRYLDYFTGDYDHVAHGTPDPAAQRLALQRIDALVGRIWTVIESSPLAARTALILISDHGMNTEPGVFSQGYDLVKFFNSRAGGAHHVVTNRHPLTEYTLKGLDPFVSEVVTASAESLYLKGVANEYPTVMLDPDGNERAAVYLRNSDWNALHVLLSELNRGLEPATRRAGIDAFFRIVDRHREQWGATVQQLRSELAALRRVMDRQRVHVQAEPVKWTGAQRDAGLDKAARRLSVKLESWREQERSYTSYADKLTRLLALTPADFDKRHITAADWIPKRAMGDVNDVYDLQNYVIGPGPSGLVLASDGALDWQRSFERIDYFRLLAGLSVRNNVQSALGSHPVDFVALPTPVVSLSSPLADPTAEEAVWIYRDQDRQALILSRHDPAGNLELRYLPVRGLRQAAGGEIHFEPAQWAAGFPLHLWEDQALSVAESDRAEWLARWHSELDWLHAVHKTEYSDGILALDEQFSRYHAERDAPGDAGWMQKFSSHKRRLAEADFLIFANDHWNFNVRGFNPGGNHGSLRRIAMRSVLLLAGGAETGIAHDLVIQEPYDSLSFVPTILRLMGKNEDARKLPGRPIEELLTWAAKSAAQ